MGLKRRFKVKKQQRWERRKARQKLAAKNKVVQQPQVQQVAGQVNPPQPPSGEAPTPSTQTK